MRLPRRTLLTLSFFSLFAVGARGQIEVELSLDKPSFMVYEPIMARVKISNFTGHTIGLFNHDSKPWLSFFVSRMNGQQVDDLGAEYDLQQVQVAGGDTLTINVNLTPVYNIRAPGLYRVMATVYSASYRRQFQSNMRQFDLTTGRVLWSETVALMSTNRPSQTDSAQTDELSPPSPNEERRTYVLLAKRERQNEQIYVRVEDELNNALYGLVLLGPLVGFGKPETMIDRNSRLHVLHQVGSRAFAYVEVLPTARVATRRTYSNMLSRPKLKADDDGIVRVEGGEQVYPSAKVLPLPEQEATQSDTPILEDSKAVLEEESIPQE